MAIVPWVSCLDWGYKAKEHLRLSDFPRVNVWVERVLSRPKTAAGMKVCPFN
jgi:GST-like protein